MSLAGSAEKPGNPLNRGMLGFADGLGLTSASVHICIDMQRLFCEEGPWPTPWMPRVLPNAVKLAGRFPDRTVFTRFITPVRPEDMQGMWRSYYERWPEATRERLDPRLLELMSPLAALVPPAIVIDKPVYSAFSGRHLPEILALRNADTLILSGTETDVCVLATALGAIDYGYRVVIAKDAVCSSSDSGHDTLLQLFEQRFSHQLHTADTDEILAAWPE
jgi:nicotinamidase-related amidase